MNSCEYDLDLSGGLMEEIERLTAPPQSDESVKKKKREHCYYKKPGKPHNHDLCDSCGEGGDLLCCDKCPASFHMECCDPPLDDEEIPMGEWVCHRCKSRPQPKPEDDDAASTCSNRSRHSESATSVSRRSSRRPSPITTAVSDMEIIQEVTRETLEPRHPLQILAKAASMMNPKQFEVPKELGCNIQFQGSSKKKWWVKEPLPGKTAAKKLPHELDNGMVPLPAKICFTCSKSCMRSPLLQCDYCPLLFHLDCLNPPLTTMPQGRWMCPNHCEHLLDEKLLKSLKLTERVKLWNQFTGPVHHHQSKIQFFNKIHRLHPPFKLKVKHKRKHMIKIPDAIKSQYEFPPPLLPRLHQTPPAMDGNRATSADDQNLWLGSLVSLHSDILKHMTGNINDSQPDTEDIPMGTPSVATITTKVTGAFAPSSTTLSPVTMTSATSKPTASVTPVVKQDINSNSKPCAALGPQPSNKTRCEMEQESPMDTSDLTNRTSGTKPVLVNGIRNSFCDEPEEEESMDIDGAVSSNSNKLCKNSPNESNNVSSTSLFEDITNSVGLGANNSNKTDTGAIQISALSNAGTTINKTSLTNSTHSASCRTKSIESQDLRNCSNSRLGRRSQSWNSDISESTSDEIGGKISPLLHLAQNGEVSSTSQSVVPSGRHRGHLQGSPVEVKVNSTSLNHHGSPDSQHKTSTLRELQDLFEDQQEEIDLSRLDSNLIHMLALQQVKQLFSGTKKEENQVKPLTGPPQLPVTGCEEVQARALLCPLTGQGEAIPMIYRGLNIGMGADMDACLNKFGTCNFVSPKHACIFYDEATRHFELLNYSEHGTTVDNVLYSCDFSQKQIQSGRSSKLVSNVRKLVKKGKSRKIKEEPEARVPVGDPNREYMNGTAYKRCASCQCKSSSSSLIGGSGAGWEGTAVLHHGSYIKLGCLQFVFSIVEQATQNPIVIHYPQGGDQLTPIKSEPPSP